MEAKILIIDDEQAIRNLLVRYLGDSGYDCHTAESVESAKKALASNTFDLLLCDLTMPGESGLELIRHAKEHYPQTGRIMITGISVPETASEIMTVGVYGYILKPTSKDMVLITVENALRHLRLDLHMNAYKVELEKSISERAKINLVYQEQLRSMTTEIAFVEERARRKIANILHDQIGQNLAVAAIKLGELRQALGPENLREQVDVIRKMISHAIQHSRTLTFELSPPILYELGLEAALSSIAERYQEEHKIPIDFNYDHLPKPLSGDLNILLFQGVRELLVNAIKHARSRKITISCLRKGAGIQIIVEDDGVGFATMDFKNMAGQNHSFGLFSLSERLNYFKGNLAIQSAPGCGTRVTLIAPVLVRPEEKGGAA